MIHETLPTIKLSLEVVARDSFHLLLAFFLALPVGWNREKQSRSAGIRTFPIVSVACCGLTLLALSIPGTDPNSFSRVLQGLVSGIGFIGAGAIMREGASVHGTATAASVWCTGIVGAAIGLGEYHIGVILSLMNYLTLRYLVAFKPEGNDLPPT